MGVSERTGDSTCQLLPNPEILGENKNIIMVHIHRGICKELNLDYYPLIVGNNGRVHLG